MNRDMLSRRLARKGFNVLLAVDGQQGVDMTLAETPALVLMDMSLPVMDGWLGRDHGCQRKFGYGRNTCNGPDRACTVRRPRKGACSRL